MLKPTAANIDKEAVRWSLSWLPDGRCDSFTKGAILLFAPPTSGVYGLFNFDCQVFIGESANIQEALLRHESETDFQSQHLQPTGFTFEPCAAELRKAKADELIARFHPVLQTEAALNETWSASNGPGVSEAGLGGLVAARLIAGLWLWCLSVMARVTHQSWLEQSRRRERADQRQRQQLAHAGNAGMRREPEAAKRGCRHHRTEKHRARQA